MLRACDFNELSASCNNETWLNVFPDPLFRAFRVFRGEKFGLSRNRFAFQFNFGHAIARTLDVGDCR